MTRPLRQGRGVTRPSAVPSAARRRYRKSCHSERSEESLRGIYFPCGKRLPGGTVCCRRAGDGRFAAAVFLRARVRRPRRAREAGQIRVPHLRRASERFRVPAACAQARAALSLGPRRRRSPGHGRSRAQETPPGRPTKQHCARTARLEANGCKFFRAGRPKRKFRLVYRHVPRTNQMPRVWNASQHHRCQADLQGVPLPALRSIASDSICLHVDGRWCQLRSIRLYILCPGIPRGFFFPRDTGAGLPCAFLLAVGSPLHRAT
jgi:hypothetical protein